ncbi:hypothetical protein YC2023_049686 [Brassica napus]
MIIFNTGVEIPLDPKGFAFIQSMIRFQRFICRLLLRLPIHCKDDEICIQTYQIRSLFSHKDTRSLPHTI